MSGKSHSPKTTIFTLGHSSRPIEDFLALLTSNQIKAVADVRRFPGSKHNPQYSGPALIRRLRALGISYQPFPDLGGRRKAEKNSPNTGWINKSFQGYADYLRTPSFKEALQSLIALAAKKRVVIICAEAVPWRCHRNLISDALTVRGLRVEHILSLTRTQVHQITPWAKVHRQVITYGKTSEGTSLARQPTKGGAVPKTFKVGDHVSWNSEAGRVRGNIIRKLTRPTRFKGYVHHASKDDPQYLIQSDKTDHIALHRGKALRKLSAGRSQAKRLKAA